MIKTRYRPPYYVDHHCQSSKYRSAPNDPQHNTTRVGVIVQLLLAARADPAAIDATYPKKQSPLELALSSECVEMVRALSFTVDEVVKRQGNESEHSKLSTQVALQQRNSLRCQNLTENFRQQILQSPTEYVSSIDIDDIDWLIENKAELTGIGEDAIHNYDGDWPFLQYVASNGLIEVVESLGTLAKIFDDPTSVKARLLQGGYGEPFLEQFQPVLHVACLRELPNMQMIELLVEKCGVDVNARALVMTKQYGELELDSTAGPTALHILAEGSRLWQLDATRYLIGHGGDVNSTNEKGETPLHIACGGAGPSDFNHTRRPGFWSADSAKTLLDLGANPNALDNSGMSPLNWARINTKAMNVLLENGADISMSKVSPLFTSIESQDLGSLNALLDAGVNPNIKDTAKSSCIHWDIKEEERWALLCASFPYTLNRQSDDSAPLVKLLIQRGADIYSPVSHRATLIHYIFEHGEYAITFAFLECREAIDFNRRDQLGQTVFLAACNSKHNSPGFRQQNLLVDKRAPFLLMLQYDADPLAVDNEGMNALHHLLGNPRMEEDAILEFLKYASP
jgi:ankyrin repeat protein